MKTPFVLGVWSLAKREILRFLRQRDRVTGALVQPLMFWAIFGAGLNASFAPEGASEASYVAYFYPGTIAMVLLFTAIFATISVIEDRNAGFLQSVLAAPVSSSAISAGKLTGATVLALVQGTLVLALAPLAGLWPGPASIRAAIGLMAVLAWSLSALGLSIAWRMDSTQGFHAIMMGFLMPMWFLSGAFFPAAGAPAPVQWLIAINPLTYGVSCLRTILVEGPSQVSLPELLIVAGSAVAMHVLAVRTTANRNYGPGA